MDEMVKTINYGKNEKYGKTIAIFGSGVYIIYIGFSSVVLAGEGHWKSGNL
jgi:hypothetical protein